MESERPLATFEDGDFTVSVVPYDLQEPEESAESILEYLGN